VDLRPSLQDVDITVKTIHSAAGTNPASSLPFSVQAMLRDEKTIIRMIKSDRNAFGNNITVGRAKNNDIIIRSGQISKLHCVFTPAENGGYELVDMKSLNGTLRNGFRLEPKKAEKLKSGDRILLWKFEFVFLDVNGLIEFLESQK
jgi:pSer/pThr/pTyr-binding forkhead associated (FHA) protein